MSTSIFDVIVIGVGSMGASTCYHLAEQGCRVLGIEQFDSPHTRGSHTGQSRIIRKAYFEHSDYIPLLHRAYENWQKLESISSTQLLYETGLVYFAPPAHPLLQSVEASAKEYQIPLQHLTSAERKLRYPAFHLPTDFATVLEPEAGFVPAEKSVALYGEWATRLGATIQTREKVQHWHRKKDEIEVVTDRETYRAKKLIITAGAWSSHLIDSLKQDLQVTRQTLAWIRPKNPAAYTLGTLPCWMVATETHDGLFYGFPILPAADFGGPVGMKIGYHAPGTPTSPDTVNQSVTPADEELLHYFLQHYMPGTLDTVLSWKTCLYTYSPDDHFVLDFLPDYEEQVLVACGFSGHGFKFASVLGEVLADLAVNGQTDLPIDFLNIHRLHKKDLPER